MVYEILNENIFGISTAQGPMRFPVKWSGQPLNGRPRIETILVSNESEKYFELKFILLTMCIFNRFQFKDPNIMINKQRNAILSSFNEAKTLY